MISFKLEKQLWQVIRLGILAGMRATSAPVITSQVLNDHHSKKLGHSPLSFMGSKIALNTFRIFALGELVADKLPSAPNRTEAGGVIARCLSGALAGASIYKASGGKLLNGAVIGASAALASTYGCFFLRRTIVKELNIFDPIVGAIEDALVIGAGVSLIKEA